MPPKTKSKRRSYKRYRQVLPLPEKKHYHDGYDITIGDVASTTNAPVFKCLNKIAQGTTSYNRIGNRISMTSCQLKMLLQASSLVSATNVRIMVVSSKRGNITSSSMPSSFLGIPDYDRYWVHYDKYHTMNSTNTTKGPINVLVNFSSYKNKTNRQAVFDTNATADPIQNPLYIYVVSNVTSANAPILSLDYNTFFRDN